MSQETIRAIEQLRQRLNNLATQLGSLRRDVENSESLPSWPSVQSSANLLSHNLSSLQSTLQSAAPLLKSAHAYPAPSFPGRQHEDLLSQLLRKKLQPPVEDWIEEGERYADEKTALGADDLEALWSWAGPEGNQIAREIGEDVFDDVFTLAERDAGEETVRTGLRRKFWDSDDEDEQDKSEKMNIDVKDQRAPVVRDLHSFEIDATRSSMSLEAVLKYTVSGQLPRL